MLDKTKISDLTVGELKEIIRDLLWETSYKSFGIDPVSLKERLPSCPDQKITIYCENKEQPKC